jgi:hypothetical protein
MRSVPEPHTPDSVQVIGRLAGAFGIDIIATNLISLQRKTVLTIFIRKATEH